MNPLRLSLFICFLLLATSTAWGATMTHGPVVGSVTPTSGTVFVRTDQATNNGFVRVFCCSNAIDTPFTTAAATDFTAKVTVSGLLPGLSYTVQIFVDGVLQSPTSTFRTFPAATSISPFTFVVLTDFAMGPSGTTCLDGPGFSECPDLASATFKSADAENPAFVVIGGDFDHRNPSQYRDPTCGTDRACKYRKMWKDLYTCANWGTWDLCAQILRRHPVVHAWDDHDYSTNNGNGGYKDRALAHDSFARYFPSYPLPPCTNGCAGIWHSFSYAYADFFVLDSRSQRTVPCAHPPTCSGSESMLAGYPVQGTDDQLTWLKDALLNSTATWKFIWSPVVFNKTLLKTDSWFGYPAERDALVAWINGNNPRQKVIKNVIVLSGDLHAGAIDQGPPFGSGQLPEMVSPGVNFTKNSTSRCQSANNRQRGSWSDGMYTTGSAATDPCNGYGVISVSPTFVTLTVKDSNGNSSNLPCVPRGIEPCGPAHRHISPLTIPAQ